MNIFNTYKRTRTFLWINITGLAIGLASAILLLLFVVNELSYDKHFANRDRIVRLLTVSSQNGNITYSPINLRNAYLELPAKTPGVEAAVQIYAIGSIEVATDQKRFQDLSCLLVDPEFFKVFQTKFIAGTPDDYLTAPNSAVLTRKQAEILFGSPEKAINKTISFEGNDFVVTAVVDAFPKNSHLSFDILAPIPSFPWLNEAMGLEFLTYYLIHPDASITDTRASIEDEYRTLLRPWGERVGDPNAHGSTQMLTDIYLKSKVQSRGINQGSMQFIWILTGLALFILILAVTNFINLFVTQGQMRMNEVGIRKANGAQIGNLVRQFFSEVAWIVLIAFAIGFFLAVIGVQHFAALIGKDIDPIQAWNPTFIGAVVVLFVLTVIVSASYPALYLSRFSPLEILGKRVKFSKRRLTASIVVFQSILSIILLSIIVTIYNQTSYLEKLPLGYNPKNLLHVVTNRELYQNYDAIRQELLKRPEIKDVGGSHHIFGSGWSGQVIAPWEEQDKPHPIAEYRLLTGMPELMELELVEGRFWRPDDPDSIRMLLLNEAAVRMLGGESPLEKTYKYYGQAQVTGVVKDFCFGHPIENVGPIALSRVFSPQVINIRFADGISPLRAQEIALAVFRPFDSEFILNPLWGTEIYARKFDEIKTIMRMVVIGSLIAMFVAMLGLLAIHLFTAQRRTKEIGIRRIHGADRRSIFILLSFHVVKCIGYAALIAVPLAIYLIDGLLRNYPNHAPLHWAIFVLPVLAQCLIALLTTSGVSLSVLSKNPVHAIQSE